MDEKQNADGTWSKAEPIKSSREEKKTEIMKIAQKNMIFALIMIGIDHILKHADAPNEIYIASWMAYICYSVYNLKRINKLK